MLDLSRFKQFKAESKELERKLKSLPEKFCKMAGISSTYTDGDVFGSMYETAFIEKVKDSYFFYINNVNEDNIGFKCSFLAKEELGHYLVSLDNESWFDIEIKSELKAFFQFMINESIPSK